MIYPMISYGYGNEKFFKFEIYLVGNISTAQTQ